jgi:dihydrofolate reductase
VNRPKTTIYIAETVDGFIARCDGEIDWLDQYAGGHDYGWALFRQSIDSLIIGRRTYEQVLGFDVGWPYGGLSTFVWSRSLTNKDLPAALSGEAVEISALPPVELLEEIGSRGLKCVWIDGGQTLQSFLAAGLVDVIKITRIPVLIGQGKPLFGALDNDIRLEHLETQSFESGVVQSTYAVTDANGLKD